MNDERDKADIFVVSWAGFDRNEDSMSSGSFCELYPNMETAIGAVRAVVEDEAKEAWKIHPDPKKAFKAKSAKDLATSMIVHSDIGPTETYIVTHNPFTNVESQYTITGYSTIFLAKET